MHDSHFAFVIDTSGVCWWNLCPSVGAKGLRMEFFLWIEEQKVGPYEPEQIHKLLGAGTITEHTLTYPEGGGGDWSPIMGYFKLMESQHETELGPPTLPAQPKDTVGAAQLLNVRLHCAP